MTQQDDRPDAVELIGLASQTTSLAGSPIAERPVDRVGALGAATLKRNAEGLPITTGDDATGAFSVVDAQLELGALLWRLKIGGDVTCRVDAAVLLDELLRNTRRRLGWWGWPGQTLARFALRAVDEYVDDKCKRCGGCGRENTSGTEGTASDSRGTVRERRVACGDCKGGATETLSNGETRTYHGMVRMRGASGIALLVDCAGCRGFGWVQRRDVVAPKRERQCRVCNGTGARQPDERGRALALCVDVGTYRTIWHRRFSQVEALLSRIEADIRQRGAHQLRGWKTGQGA